MNEDPEAPEPTEEEKHESVKRKLQEEEDEERKKFAKLEWDFLSIFEKKYERKIWKNRNKKWWTNRQEDGEGFTFEERVEIFKVNFLWIFWTSSL